MLDGDVVRWISEKGSITRDSLGEVTRIIGAMIDVTDLKSTEAALQAAEERLARAVRGTQDGLWEFNAVDRSFWFAPRFAQMLGYEPCALATHLDSFLDLVHAEDRERTKAEIWKHVGGEASYDVEFRLRHQLGHHERGAGDDGAIARYAVRCAAEGLCGDDSRQRHVAVDRDQ